MGTYYDGSKVVSAVKGTEASASLFDDAEDVHVDYLSSRERCALHSIVPTSEVIDGTWQINLQQANQITVNTGVAAADGALIQFGLEVEERENITAVYASIAGTAGATGGAIKFYYGVPGSLSSQDLDITDPWDSAATLTKSVTGLNLTVDTNWVCFFYITAAANAFAATKACVIHNVWADVEKGRLI